MQHINSIVDLPAIRNAGLNVTVDAMFGAGGGYLPSILAGGATKVTEIHGHPNPAFPGMAQPEPIAPNLAALIQNVKDGKSSIGLALDGDADRIGAVDQNGRFITTLEVFSLSRPLSFGVQGTARPHRKGRHLFPDAQQVRPGVRRRSPLNLPVGFKNIGPQMSQVDALIAGEESGGFAFRGHVPERDGILSGLYLLEYMARTGNSPSKLLDRLFERVGPHYFHRRDLVFDPVDRARLEQLLGNGGLTELAGNDRAELRPG